jgi:integrase
MVKVDLKGIATATAKGHRYYYAWRGGPRLVGKPGSPEFFASYQEAHASRRTPDDGRMRALVTLYKASPDYRALADSTRRQWAPWLDKISDHFGDLRVAQFDRTDKIRPVIRRWRDKWADRPRTADYGLQVLSRVLAYAVDPLDKITRNPCEGIKRLYSANRAAVIWTDTDLERIAAHCSPEVALAVDLAAASGLRKGDLLRLSWSHIGENQIEIATGKSNSRRAAIIPIYEGLRAVLERIPRRSTAVLTNSLGRPWTSDGFGTAFNRAKIAAGMADRDLHFHDLRGTAATRFYSAGLSERTIAEIMAWEEAHVSRIMRRYVDRNALTLATIQTLDQTERRTGIAKPTAKP